MGRLDLIGQRMLGQLRKQPDFPIEHGSHAVGHMLLMGTMDRHALLAVAVIAEAGGIQPHGERDHHRQDNVVIGHLVAVGGELEIQVLVDLLADTNSQLKCLTERIRFFALTKPSAVRRYSRYVERNEAKSERKRWCTN